MKKIFLGLALGILAGLIDISPMFIGKMPWAAIISAFSLWVISGFFISVINLKMFGVIKGIMVSVLVLLPAAVLIADKEMTSLLPIGFMTLILGGLLGFFFEKLTKVKSVNTVRETA